MDNEQIWVEIENDTILTLECSVFADGRLDTLKLAANKKSKRCTGSSGKWKLWKQSTSFDSFSDKAIKFLHIMLLQENLLESRNLPLELSFSQTLAETAEKPILLSSIASVPRAALRRWRNCVLAQFFVSSILCLALAAMLSHFLPNGVAALLPYGVVGILFLTVFRSMLLKYRRVYRYLLDISKNEQA